MVGGVALGLNRTFGLSVGMALLRGEVNQVLVGGDFNKVGLI